MASSGSPKILLLVENEELREVLRSIVESEFRLELLEATTPAAAIDAVNNHPELAAVVCDLHAGSSDGAPFFRALLGRETAIPFLFCADASERDLPIPGGAKPEGYVSLPYRPEEVVATLSDVLKRKLGLDPTEIRNVEKFRPVRTRALAHGGVLDFDVYLKLAGGKYVKIFRRGDFFGAADLKHYDGKKLEELYVPSDVCARFLSETARLVWAMAQARAVDADGSAGRWLSAEVHRIIHHIHGQLGVTQEMRELTKATVDLATRLIGSNPDLKKVFAAFPMSPESYLPAHSLVLAHVACGLAARMSWLNDATAFKLVMAAFVHDITITNAELAPVQNMGDLMIARTTHDYSSADLESFNEHPVHAAELARKIESLPDLEEIVALHHELPDGTGFPRGIRHDQFPPLAALFNIAHDLVTFGYEHGNRPSFAQFFREKRARYSQGQFRRIIDQIAVDLASTTGS